MDLGRRRPADTFVQSGAVIKTGTGRNLLNVALDVGIINPQAPTNVTKASEGTLEAADKYTEKKRAFQNTDALCAAAGIDYQPLVFESFGGCSAEARETLKSINRLVANNTNTPTSEVARRFWQKVSTEIQKSNHRSFAKRTVKQQFYNESASRRFLRVIPEEDGQ